MYSCLAYQEFYRKVSLNQDYVFDPRVKLGSVTGEDYINSFITYLDKKWGLMTIDLNMILNFVEFGFSYRLRTLNEFNKISYIKFNYIFCTKMYDLFSKQKNKIVSRRRLKEINSDVFLKIKNVKQRIDFENMITSTSKEEESLKKMYYNKEEGIVWCASQTNMFNHKSDLCNSCNVRVRCKNLLKENLPQIFKIRGYE